VLPLLLMSFFGQRLFDALRRAPAEAWIGAGVGVATIVLVAWAVRRRRRAQPPSGELPTIPAQRL
jgi:hypothetical protein